jgi:hypothetical protein
VEVSQPGSAHEGRVGVVQEVTDDDDDYYIVAAFSGDPDPYDFAPDESAVIHEKSER